MQLQDLYKFVLLSVCKILRQSGEISFPLLFQKNADVSIFVKIQG